MNTFHQFSTFAISAISPEMRLFAAILGGGALLQLVLINCGRRGLLALLGLLLVGAAAAHASVPVAPGFSPSPPSGVTAPPGYTYRYGIKVVHINKHWPAMVPAYKTAALVHGNFPAVINANFALPNVNTLFATLTDEELGDVTHLYALENKSSIAALAKIAAQHLSATNLVRFAAAAGPQVVGQAVSSYAPYAVQSAYFKANPLAPLRASLYKIQSMSPHGVVPGANPGINMTIEEIYLEFRTSGWALGAVDAAFATSMYVTANLGAAGTFGYGVGNGLLWVGDKLSPGFSEALAGFLGENLMPVVFEPTPTDVSDYLGSSPTDGTETMTFNIHFNEWQNDVVQP